MKYNILIKISIIIILIFLVLYITNYYIKNNIIENYCKINNNNNFGDINDKRVLLDYAPQENITTSSCQDYWKEFPKEFNNNLVTQLPVPINSKQLVLPKEKIFGDNTYKRGLINFVELANIIKDEDDETFLDGYEEGLINPITKKKLDYKYKLEFNYDQLNKKTWINRWQEFNPVIKNTFNYDEIKSDIEDINILNKEFLKRINIRQKNILTDKQLILYGLINFDIFKYRIIRIEYKNNDTNSPLYIIEISLYRNSDLFISTFSYMGIIVNGVNKLYNVLYIGGNSTDNYLLPDFYNPDELTQEIINKNYSNKVEFERNASAVIKIEKDQEQGYKIKNQYACFNILDSNDSKNEYILPYFNRDICEAMYDEYGKTKPIGIYDSPCKKNEECPFYKLNKNYENEFGKCLDTGYCQLPSNMEPVGYHYFRPNKKPLCYNCGNKKFEKYGDIDTCCDDQHNKEKYPELKSPDYAFEKDIEARYNYYTQKNCYKRYDDETLICNK
jgi:hypothetical protein